MRPRGKTNSLRAQIPLTTSVVVGALALAGCTAQPEPAPSSPASTSIEVADEATPTISPTASAKLDAVALGQACLDAFHADAYGIRDSDPTSASAAVRPDGLLFVTLPTQTRAISGGGEVYLPADLYCYLEQDTLQPHISPLGYEAIGVTVNLETEYDLLFDVEEPIDDLLD